MEIDSFISDGRTALHLTSEGGGGVEIVDFILKQSLEIIKIADNKGNTALHSAISAKHRKIIESLIKKRADINASNIEGCTPLHLAVIESDNRYCSFFKKNNLTLI